MILIKLIGWGCLFFGGLVIIGLPISGKNQPEDMTKAGIIFGIIMIGLGLLLIKM